MAYVDLYKKIYMPRMPEQVIVTLMFFVTATYGENVAMHSNNILEMALWETFFRLLG